MLGWTQYHGSLEKKVAKFTGFTVATMTRTLLIGLRLYGSKYTPKMRHESAVILLENAFQMA